MPSEATAADTAGVDFTVAVADFTAAMVDFAAVPVCEPVAVQASGALLGPVVELASVAALMPAAAV
jgi:hypothetical protein